MGIRAREHRGQSKQASGPKYARPGGSFIDNQKTDPSKNVAQGVVQRVEANDFQSVMSQAASMVPAAPFQEIVQCRVPKYDSLNADYTGGVVPKASIERGFRVALTRMKEEGRLKSDESIDVIMGKIFPDNATVSKVEYENAVDVADKTKVYHKAADAKAQIEVGDVDTVKQTITAGEVLITQSRGDDTNMTRVFGGKKAEAKEVYGKAKVVLGNVKADLNQFLNTDYNKDDDEMSIGGYANFKSQTIHLKETVVKATDANKSKTTVIHESTHLADAKVLDKGYYGTPSFEAMSEDQKWTNAAHYEEIPKRKLGVSDYGNEYVFTPGMLEAGVPPTYAEKGRRFANEVLRKAWAKANNKTLRLRARRVEILAGKRNTFENKLANYKATSRLFNLTIHEQPAGQETVTQLDLVLSEGISHGIRNAMRILEAVEDVTVTQAIDLAADDSSPKEDQARDWLLDEVFKTSKIIGNAQADKHLVTELNK